MDDEDVFKPAYGSAVDPRLRRACENKLVDTVSE